MNKQNKVVKALIIFLMIITLTGCSEPLKDKDNKVVKNPETGQSITANVICKPTDKTTLKLYKENKINVEKLPDCNKMKISGKYEDIWNSIFVRPLGYLIVNLGKLVGSTALSIIIITLLIRGALYPTTKNSMMQSQNMKKAKPELDRLEKKYANKTDQESQTKKAQEMMLIYKKYNIKPLSGCLFIFIQIPILFAFYEAIMRVPAIFEGSFLGLNMGKTPLIGIKTGDWYYVILCIILIAITYFSYKLNPSTQNMSQGQNEMMPMNSKGMTIGMTAFIGFMSFTLPTAIGIYWIVTSTFTVIQNLALKKGMKANE